jgi:uncharacterized membrane protein YtjA (UPF0391 family)
MLRWATVFLIIGLAAGVFGLWGFEGMVMQLARILFLVFIVLFVVSSLMACRSQVD